MYPARYPRMAAMYPDLAMKKPARGSPGGSSQEVIPSLPVFHGARDGDPERIGRIVESIAAERMSAEKECHPPASHPLHKVFVESRCNDASIPTDCGHREQ